MITGYGAMKETEPSRLRVVIGICRALRVDKDSLQSPSIERSCGT